MTSKEIRRQFLDFFASKGHAIVESSPVVPLDDPTLMFTNAGMNQFKDVFLGTGSRPYRRAADTQKCIRAGGKHNDLDDVGQDTYHHTYFEMLGNWSFGDYFKKEAIEWAWELLTGVWGIPKDRLHATYFGGLRKGGSDEATKRRSDEATLDAARKGRRSDEGGGEAPPESPPRGGRAAPPDGGEVGSAVRTDSVWELEPDYEARDLWLKVTDIDPSHVHPGSMKDNFWEMGETGPCGPCSEIHIDLTPDKSGTSLVNKGDARVIELWNLVFIQFNRAAGGDLSPLPAKHVDTGMGFERLCAVLQATEHGLLGGAGPARAAGASLRTSVTGLAPGAQMPSNYDTDVFTPIFAAIRKRTGAPAYAGTLPGEKGSRDPGIEGARDKGVGSAVRTNSASRPEPQASACANIPDSRIVQDAGRSRRLTLDASRQGQAPAAQDDEPSRWLNAVGSVVRTKAVTHEQVMVDVSYRVIADHIRCLTFAMTDGALPSNEGRGYVLRRILRRAVRYGRQYLDMHEPFLCDLVEPLVAHMGEVFPELRTAHGGRNVEHVAEIIRDEEESFGKTLDRGIRLFEEAAEMALKRHHGRISGDDAFKLHDTYGFPIDLTELMAEERGLKIDIGEYARQMERARERARTVEDRGRYGEEKTLADLIQQTKKARETEPHKALMGAASSAPPPPKRDLNDPFERETYRVLSTGESCDDTLKYVEPFSCAAYLWGLSHSTCLFDTDAAKQNEEVFFSTNRTPFYAAQGGQVSDTGWLTTDSGHVDVVEVVRHGSHVFHRGVVRDGQVWLGVCELEVDRERRARTMKNHSATHMLNWALREVLGDHIQQKGSLVDPEKTRFDFSHNKPLSPEELARIERLVNERIEADEPVYTKEVDQKKAREINTLRAVFGEKYPDVVRVVSIGAPITEAQAKECGEEDWLLRSPANPEWMKYPVEFCGGTHLKRSSKAERFVLIHEEGVAKGVRRVVGITGEAALQAEETGRQLLAEAEAMPRLVDRRSASESEPQASACENTPDSGNIHNAERSRGLKPAAQDAERSRGLTLDASRQGQDFAARLAAYQQKLNDAVIPVTVRHELRERLASLQKVAKEHEKREAADAGGAVMDAVAGLLEEAEEVGGVKIVVGAVPAAPPDSLRGAIDWVRNKTAASAVLLAMAGDDKVTLIAGMSKDVVKKGVKAGDLIKEIAPLVGGKGGGRPDMAQGGGNSPAGIPNAVNHARSWIREQLA